MLASATVDRVLLAALAVPALAGCPLWWATARYAGRWGRVCAAAAGLMSGLLASVYLANLFGVDDQPSLRAVRTIGVPWLSLMCVVIPIRWIRAKRRERVVIASLLQQAEQVLRP